MTGSERRRAAIFAVNVLARSGSMIPVPAAQFGLLPGHSVSTIAMPRGGRTANAIHRPFHRRSSSRSRRNCASREPSEYGADYSSYRQHESCYKGSEPKPSEFLSNLIGLFVVTKGRGHRDLP